MFDIIKIALQIKISHWILEKMRLGFVISDKMTMTDVNNRRVLTDTLQSGEMICNVNNYCKIYVLLNCYQQF